MSISAPVVNPKLVTISNPLRGNRGVDQQETEIINQKYSAVLDHLLTPPQVKEQLMKTQPLEKKKQMCEMYKQVFEQSGPKNNKDSHQPAAASGWGDKENALLSTILKAKTPDLQSLSKLKIILSTANREFMTSFLESGGVSSLLKMVDQRLLKRPFTELDIAVLYEVLSCFKAVMNNPIGMDGIANSPGSIDILTRCLRFDYKLFSIQVLEILSVCCFYSETTARSVLHGMRQQAKYYQEAPFASIINAIVEQDIEVKAATLQFVNNLIMGVDDTNIRLSLRTELAVQLFDEKLDQTNHRLDKELDLLNSTEGTNSDAPVVQTQNKLKRKSVIAMYGPKALDDKKVEAMLKNPNAANMNVSETAGEVAKEKFEVKSNNLSMTVCPQDGTMAGLLSAAKNTEKLESKFLDMVGGKKTKRRWFELDAENFKWCAGHDKEQDYKGAVSIGTVSDIRPYSTDPYLLAATAPKLHCFEIETLERTYAFGCESEVEKEHWLTAFQRCRDNYIIAKGTYKMQYRELSVSDVAKFTDRFRKDVVVYTTIAMEDRRNQVESCGFNLDNVDDLSRYLIHEATAMGTIGPLQSILYELLVLPPGLEGMWEGLRLGVASIRDRAERNSDKVRESFNHSSVVEMFQAKTVNNGAQYSQVNKLALKAMNGEQEIERLQGEIKALKETVEKLQKGGATIAPSHTHHRSAPLPPPQITTADTAVASSAFSSQVSISSPHTEVTVAAPISQPPLRRAPMPPPPVAQLPEPQKVSPVIPPPSVPPVEKPVINVPPIVTSPPAPTTSVAPLASAPTPIADERYAKYGKMRKMLPEGAVRQKMMVEGFSQEEIDAFFNGEVVAPASAPPAPTSAPLPVADDRYAKYDKMRKMLPEGAVRQKMMVEGFSQEEIDAYFNGEVVAPTPMVPVATPTAVADERFAKFEKMRKMLPEGAVRQKMQIEGFSQAEIDAFFNGEIPVAAAPAAAPASAAPAVDERYAKYDKMRKMLPEGAVRQKMMVEGFSQAEIDAFFNGEIPVAAAPAPAPPAAPAVDERFSKYDKMRKMLPEGAVRQKMQVDGFTPAEIDAFFRGEVPTTAVAPSPPAPAVDERFSKYDKMRKMLPEGAVRQKMQVDGFTQSEIDAFFKGEIPAAAPAAPAAPAVDERYAKYDKMRKMLPEGAVRQKMQVEGFSPAEIDAFFKGEIPTASATPASLAAPAVDERFAKYDKMRKMLPEGAVRQKMQADGFTQAEIDGFFGSSGAAPAPVPVAKPVVVPKAAPVDSPPEGMAEKPKIKPGMKLKGLFWTKMKNLEVQNTIWYKLQEYGMSEEDRKMLEEWFAAKVSDVTAGAASAGGNASAKNQQPQQPKLLSVLDGKRTQNVSILMGKLRKGPEEITQMLIALDPNELTVELTSRLIENLPTTEELNAVKEFKDSSGLDNASKLIFEFNRIPRLNQRMECHELAFIWGNNANTASKDINIVTKACKELQDSKSNMEKILGMILSIGNHINGDTARGQAYGVKIDVFSKLVNLKAMLPSQGSLMNFLALLAEHHAPDVMTLSQPWVAIWVAADIQFKQLQTDVNQLETQVNKVTMELSKIKEGKENPGLDGSLEDINGPVTKPLHARLTNFLNIAKPQLATIKESLSSAEKNLEKVMNDYGESLKATVEGDPGKRFFTIIVEFARGFQAAYDDNVAKRQAQEKAAKALAEAESKAQAKGPSMGSMAALAKLAVANRQQHQAPSSDSSPIPTPPTPPTSPPTQSSDSSTKAPGSENLFSRFQQAQNASANDLLAEFKNKLNKRQNNN